MINFSEMPVDLFGKKNEENKENQHKQVYLIMYLNKNDQSDQFLIL